MNLVENYTRIRTYTESICDPLQIEDYSIQPADYVSPAKWHLAHTTWFFETFVLKKYLENYQEYNASFNFLFNSYYNTVGDRILQSNRGNMSRPTTDDIYKYRKYVDAKMLVLLQDQTNSTIHELVILGLNHEQQHQELLLTDIKYMLGHNPLFPKYNNDSNLVNDINIKSGFVQIEEGVYRIGHQEKTFSYDNESGSHKVYLNKFEINEALITNGEYIQFIESGGYTNFNLWLDDGWTWVEQNNIEAPLYWHKINEEWHYYTLNGLQKVDHNAILSHVSFFEANAFAEWVGLRLPTEFEWEVASHKLNWGKRWEWTSSAYLPYPNFKKAEGAVGEYNGKFMNSKMVLRGASVATSKNHSRSTYRNFFNSHERWQFTGIRLVK